MKMDEPDVLELMVINNAFLINPCANMERPHPQFGEGVTAYTPLELSHLIFNWAQAQQVAKT